MNEQLLKYLVFLYAIIYHRVIRHSIVLVVISCSLGISGMYSVKCVAGVDYEATPLTATFNIGDIIATVTIPVVDDAMVDEEEEEFSVTLGIIPDTGVRVELGNVSTVKGIIQDTSKESSTKKLVV